jgi:hypothetical protein
MLYATTVLYMLVLRLVVLHTANINIFQRLFVQVTTGAGRLNVVHHCNAGNANSTATVCIPYMRH